tara:strand:+ start:57 stop:290 length:234 start_codon:yes stop_codon:yes gene_type:complete
LKKLQKKRIDRNGTSLIGRCSARELILFFVLPRKERGNPAHKTTHLQTAASQPCKPKFAKELFFCRRTSSLPGTWVL